MDSNQTKINYSSNMSYIRRIFIAIITKIPFSYLKRVVVTPATISRVIMNFHYNHFNNFIHYNSFILSFLPLELHEFFPSIFLYLLLDPNVLHTSDSTNMFSDLCWLILIAHHGYFKNETCRSLYICCLLNTGCVKMNSIVSKNHN